MSVTTFNDNIQLNAPKHIDTRYINLFTPYANVGAANAAIPSGYRYLGLTVLIGTTEYWYQAGITDGDLVAKGGGGSTKFGFAGQDATAAENRYFATTLHSFEIGNGTSGTLQYGLKFTSTDVYTRWTDIANGRENVLDVGTSGTTLASFDIGNGLGDATIEHIDGKTKIGSAKGTLISNETTYNGSFTPAPSAVLEVRSIGNFGFLPPTMATANKNAISSPAEGLIVYDTTLHKLYCYDGSVWQACW